MTHDNFSNPLSKNTPIMTAAGVLQWLDLEIDYLKEQYAAETHSTVKLVLMGTWLHLGVMKEQFAGYAMQKLDEDTK